MIKLPSHYSIQIPTKPYLAKYITTLYAQKKGDQSLLIFNKSNPFCMVLYAFMTKNEYRDRSLQQIQYRCFNVLNHQLTVYLPKHWIAQRYHDGSTVKEENALAITQLFEVSFEEALYRYCDYRTKLGVVRRLAIEEFAIHYNLEIPEDITYDNLKQTEYRYRLKQLKKIEKSALELSRQIQRV